MNQDTHPPTRIIAIDVLRGFDMFWITGGLPLFLALMASFSDPLPEFIQYHTRHVQWEGFAAWDLIMPLFMFVVGASMPFSLLKRRDAGDSRRQLYFKVIKRVLILFILGMIAQGHLLRFELVHLDLYCNTLQAIAAGYLISAPILLELNTRNQLIAFASLLISYWLLMMFIPVGNLPAGEITPQTNVAMVVDQWVLGRFRDGTAYTWVLSSLSFGAMVLSGAFAGQILKQHQLSHKKRLLTLIYCGLASLFIGWIWSFHFPIIKHLYTSSMVCWAIGWSFLLLAIFYALTDCLGWHKPFFPLVVIGANPLFVYLWTCVCNPEHNLSAALFRGFTRLFGSGENFVFYALNYLFIWGILYFLYRKKCFIKV